MIRNGCQDVQIEGQRGDRPDEMIARYGADATRMYALFAAPPAGPRSGVAGGRGLRV